MNGTQITYARVFMVGVLTANSFCVNGGLAAHIFYGVLAAHFITKSVPWALEKLELTSGGNLDFRAQRGKTKGKIC
jgi:hypothetical protein